MYDYLQGIPIEVRTYNFGTVSFIGVVIYCGGTHRVKRGVNCGEK